MPPPVRPLWKGVLFAAVWALGVLALIFAIFLSPPTDFPKGAVVSIPAGTSVREAGAILVSAHVIRNATLFGKVIALVYPHGIVANDYAFSRPESLFTIAHRLAEGKTELTPIKVTFPEGSTALEMAGILKRALPDFDANSFYTLAKPYEGTLFPDTYFIMPGSDPAKVISTMRAEYEQHLAPLRQQIAAFGHPESDVIIMASILEEEARQPETRQIVAGILWKRLANGMPLQVDSVFGYILGKSGYAPTPADLKIDSPYNTYIHTGLPPGPIGNPGVASIQAAITPIATPYLYYVTDKEGNIYYAATFAQHQANIQKALH